MPDILVRFRSERLKSKYKAKGASRSDLSSEGFAVLWMDAKRAIISSDTGRFVLVDLIDLVIINTEELTYGK